jgi:hypothetical protein
LNWICKAVFQANHSSKRSKISHVTGGFKAIQSKKIEGNKTLGLDLGVAMVVKTDSNSSQEMLLPAFELLLSSNLVVSGDGGGIIIINSNLVDDESFYFEQTVTTFDSLDSFDSKRFAIPLSPFLSK